MITVKRFTSTWCQPCKQLAPLFEQLRSEYPNVSFQTIAQISFNKPKSDGVGAVCRGEQKTAYGYIWKFK